MRPTKFYDQVIDLLRHQWHRTVVTLYHFDLPYRLVEQYNGWESRECVHALSGTRELFFALREPRKYWQVHNEQNLMIRVDERMNIRAEDLQR